MRDWTPIRRGDIYCSDGCGGGCKHRDYLLAQRRAKVLCKALGPGWSPNVWENLGWHYQAVKGACKISPSHLRGRIKYMAIMNWGAHSIVVHNTSAVKVRDEVIFEAEKIIRQCRRQLAAVKA